MQTLKSLIAAIIVIAALAFSHSSKASKAYGLPGGWDVNPEEQVLASLGP